MSHAALTAKYRPQTFAQVAGQDTIKAILSRASLEAKVAPAYLFSGTRGVGKTTLARIFAKALNCRQSPTAEPCNQCDQCRAITAGSAVDVVEIDGASNRGIDDVRRLKEVVGYAPMEGAYKIFIIDEAHMLSREAFNALLKTLEEPPAKVTFVMATTEPHKFPATIISRCQHYVFKRLPESGLVSHLSNILNQEKIDYDETAVSLIARRGSGSVRDSMSLLGQVLALGQGRLTEEAARNVLGLAGQEAFMQLLEACKDGDTLRLSTLLRNMLDQGLDMGFFLRELGSLWRNLFMLKQSGEAALCVVDLPEKEARQCLDVAKDFSLQHIHACWQMTLEGQRRVLSSLEPALALELLLLNIAMLPKLLPLENVSTLKKKGSSPVVPPSPAPLSQGSGPPPVPPTPANPQMSKERQTVGMEETKPEQKKIEEFTDETQVLENRKLQSINPNGSPTVFVHEENDHPKKEKIEIPRWEELLAICEEQNIPAWLSQLLKRCDCKEREGSLLIFAQDDFTAERLRDPEATELIKRLLEIQCGHVPDYEIKGPDKPRKSREQLKAEILEHPLVKEIENHLGACIIDYGQLR